MSPEAGLHAFKFGKIYRKIIASATKLTVSCSPQGPEIRMSLS